MRELVMSYLSNKLSRRGFIKKMSAAGFSAVAANEILRSLNPLTISATDGLVSTGAAAGGSPPLSYDSIGQ